jgi:hypothetical protein
MSRLSIILVTLVLASADGPARFQTGKRPARIPEQSTKLHSETNIQKSDRALFDCLPDGFKATDVVSYVRNVEGSEKHITVADKLTELKARCRKGELFDGNRKGIKFFRFACYGNPPSDYEEIRQKETEELEKLQKTYTVIAVECDPRIS